MDLFRSFFTTFTQQQRETSNHHTNEYNRNDIIHLVAVLIVAIFHPLLKRALKGVLPLCHVSLESTTLDERFCSDYFHHKTSRTLQKRRPL